MKYLADERLRKNSSRWLNSRRLAAAAAALDKVLEAEFVGVSELLAAFKFQRQFRPSVSRSRALQLKANHRKRHTRAGQLADGKELIARTIICRQLTTRALGIVKTGQASLAVVTQAKRNKVKVAERQVAVAVTLVDAERHIGVNLGTGSVQKFLAEHQTQFLRGKLLGTRGSFAVVTHFFFSQKFYLLSHMNKKFYLEFIQSLERRKVSFDFF